MFFFLHPHQEKISLLYSFDNWMGEKQHRIVALICIILTTSMWCVSECSQMIYSLRDDVLRWLGTSQEEYASDRDMEPTDSSVGKIRHIRPTFGLQEAFPNEVIHMKCRFLSHGLILSYGLRISLTFISLFCLGYYK